jgi:hypothetical protein
VAGWQLVVLGFLVLLPFALLVDLHPHRERLTSGGQPLDRPWEQQVHHAPSDEHH